MRRAFTLVELLIVVAIVAVIAIVTLTNFFGASKSQNLTGTGSEIVALAREAQSNAMSGYQGTAWGIYFSNATNTKPFYAIISSSTYSTGTVVSQYPLPSDVAFATSTLATGATTTVAFSPVSGATTASTTITIYSVQNPSLVYNITFHAMGQVSYNTMSTVASNPTLGVWQTTSPIPLNESGNGTITQLGFAYNGYMHVMDMFNSPTIWYAAINSNGSLGSFATTTPLRNTGAYTIVPYDNYVYLVGGEPDPGGFSTTSVLYATMNSNGTLGAWAKAQTLPSPLSENVSAAYNGYLYVVGGWNDGILQGTSTVLYATINATGSLGSWVKTTPLPAVTYGPPGLVYNGYLYDFGGYYAKINANGTVGSWSSFTGAPLGKGTISPFAANGYLYIAGGDTSTVYYAPLNSDGSVGTWQTTTALPSVLQLGNQSAYVFGNYVYIVGGVGANGNSTSTILYSSL